MDVNFSWSTEGTDAVKLEGIPGGLQPSTGSLRVQTTCQTFDTTLVAYGYGKSVKANATATVTAKNFDWGKVHPKV
jgi:hypothetical protein